MTWARFRFGAALACLMSLPTACAAPQEPTPRRDMAEVLRQMREDPEERPSARPPTAKAAMATHLTDLPFEAFFAGLFDVSQRSASHAFCAALYETIVSGDLSEDDLNAFRKPKDVRGAAPAGIVLRKLIEAHERLKGQEAVLPPDLKEPPAPAS